MAINSFKVKNSLNVAPQAAPPSSPALGDVYVDLLGNYFRWSGVAWTSLGSAGSGGINYLINSNKAWNFDDGASTGWGVYADAAGVAPVDGTGGSPNVTFAASATAPLRGAYSGLFTKDAANRQGQGVSVDFTLDTQDVGKPFTFSFDTSASSAFTGLSGTESMRVYCYDVTNAALLPGYVDVAPGSSTTKGFFLATSSTSYRFILHVSGTGTSAWTLKIDNVTIGQQVLGFGATVTDWITVPYDSGNFLSNSGTWATTSPDQTSFLYKRNGNEMVIALGLNSINVTGTVSELRLKIPDNKTMGSTFRAQARYNDGGTVVDVVITGASGNNYVGFVKLAGGNFSTTANSSDFNVEFSIPIAEWASNTVIADRAVEEFVYNTNTADSDNTTAFGYGAAGVAFGSYTTIRSKRVQFQTPIQPTDKIILEVSFNAGITWQDVQSVQGTVMPYINANSVAYGMGITSISANSTQVDVVFGSYRSVAAGGFGAAGNTWAGIVSSGIWRVRKIAGGALVGYPINQANIVYDPTTLDDINSTLVGSKEYFHGTTYNGGIAPTITLSGVSVTGTLAGTFIPYKMKSGNWRMRFNMRISPTNATAISGNTFNVIVNGVTYKNVSGQSDAVTHATSTNTNQGVSAYTNPNANTITYRFSTSSNYNSTDYYLSGDVQLESKPTWAY